MTQTDKPNVRVSTVRDHYAIIDEDDVVINIIVADDDFVTNLLPKQQRAIRLPERPDIGWRYKDGRFEPPPPEDDDK